MEAIVKSPFKAIADWWQSWKRSWAAVAELDRCGSDEAEHIAHDVCVSASELRALAGRWPDTTNLLSRRLSALGIDETAVARREPGVLRDLKRVCSLCSETSYCKHDLSRNPSDPVWQAYCPNVMTLQALKAERAR
jgi:hypothetical protein